MPTPTPLKDINRQFNPEDVDRVKVFYEEYYRLAESVQRDWQNRSQEGQSRDFDDSIAMLKSWGASGLHQNYCGFCSHTSPIRALIAQMPAIIALRVLNDRHSISVFEKMMRRYVREKSRVNNISEPKPTSSLIYTDEDKGFPDLLGPDAHRALMIYGIMRGDDHSANEEWKNLTLSELKESSNYYYPVADDVPEFILDMAKVDKPIFDIVKVRRIDANAYHVCSSLYLSYAEYLYMLHLFHPRYKHDQRAVSRAASTFIANADHRLLSPVSQRLLGVLANISNVHR